MRTHRRVAAVALLLVVAGATPAAPTPTPPRSFTIAAAGDIIPHESLVDAANAYLPGYGWDFNPMMATSSRGYRRLTLPSAIWRAR